MAPALPPGERLMPLRVALPGRGLKPLADQQEDGAWQIVPFVGPAAGLLRDVRVSDYLPRNRILPVRVLCILYSTCTTRSGIFSS